MKNKNITIISIVLIMAGLILAEFFVFKQDKPLDVNKNDNYTQEGDSLDTEQMENKLVTDDFSLNLPTGWIKTDAIKGVTAMAINSKENITDPAAKAINFKTYIAVSEDILNGKSLKEYMQIVKDGLRETISNVIFSNENEVVINERPAYAMEANLTQQNVNFKVLMVAVHGEGDDVWVISFNTIAGNWADYENIFSNIANSFTLKK